MKFQLYSGFALTYKCSSVILRHSPSCTWAAWLSPRSCWEDRCSQFLLIAVSSPSQRGPPLPARRRHRCENKAAACLRTAGGNSTHRCPIKPTGDTLESNQRWLKLSYWWIYQPLAEVPEAPGFVVGPDCQLSLRSCSRNPNPSLVLNLLLVTLITTSKPPEKRFAELINFVWTCCCLKLYHHLFPVFSYWINGLILLYKQQIAAT